MKRIVLFLLALALLISSVSGVAMQVYADEPTTEDEPVAEEYILEEPAVEPEIDTYAFTSDAKAVSVQGKCARPEITVTIDESSGKPVLTWPAVEGAAKYYIYRSISGGEEKCIASTTETTYTHIKASTGKAYTYRVKAVASVSGYASDYSNKVTCKVKCAQPKITVASDVSMGKPSVKWEAVEGAAKYYIYRSEANGAETCIASTTQTVCVDNKATVGMTYTYRVKAVAAESGYASIHSNAVTCKAKCGQPQIAVTSDISTGKPVVKWDTIEGAAKYYIYRSEPNGAETYIASTAQTVYIDNKATVGMAYTYGVKAVAAKSGYAGIHSDAVTCNAKCAQPKIKVTPSVPNGRPTVKWEAIEGATKYYIYRTAPGGEEKCIASTTKTSYIDTKATAGKTYTYRVKAVTAKSGFASVHSEAVECKAMCARPVVTSYNNAGGKTVVKWDAINGAAKYYVYRSEKGGEERYIGVTSKLYYADSSAEVGVTYIYRVKAIAATSGYASQYSQPVTGARKECIHKWNAATCTEAKKCQYCATTKDKPLGHDFNNNVCSRCDATCSVTMGQTLPIQIECFYASAEKNSRATLDISNMKYTVSANKDGTVNIKISLDVYIAEMSGDNYTEFWVRLYDLKEIACSVAGEAGQTITATTEYKKIPAKDYTMYISVG